MSRCKWSPRERAELRRITVMGSMILNFLTIKWNLIVSAVCGCGVCALRELVAVTERRVQKHDSAQTSSVTPPSCGVRGRGRTFSVASKSNNKHRVCNVEVKS